MSKNEPIQRTEDADNVFASKKETDFGVNASLANEQGAPLCNTAPPKYNGTHLLRSGIDSLYLSFRGCVRSELLSQLEEKKEIARGEGRSGKTVAALRLADIPFRVHAKGQGMHSYVISNRLLRLRIAGEKTLRVPPLYMELSSELLSCYGYESALQAAKEVADLILVETDYGAISRIDLCTDFVSLVRWHKIEQVRWCCRSKHYAEYRESEQVTGFVFGQSGVVSARLYNKSKEIEKSGKYFFKELWQKNGWDGNQPVWRLEFQLRREALKSCRSTDPLLIIELFNSLWRFYATSWLSLREVNPSDNNRSRWPISPEWRTIANANFNSEPAQVIRRFRFDCCPQDESLFIGATGYLVSFMVKHDYPSFEEAVSKFVERARAYFLVSENKRLTYDAYVDKKIAEKQVKFIKLGKLLESEK